MRQRLMEGRTTRSLFAAVAVAGLIVAGCATAPESTDSTPTPYSPNEFAGAPDWVMRGCVAVPADADHERLCGVGSAGGSSNPSMMRKAAVARARTEIARSLDVEVQSMLEDFRSTKAGAAELGTSPEDEQRLVDLSKQITNFALSGTEHRDTWISNSGTWYALVVLEVGKFKDAVGRMSDVPEPVRKAVEDRADASFARGDESTPEK